jgi:hypothetical protein
VPAAARVRAGVVAGTSLNGYTCMDTRTVVLVEPLVAMAIVTPLATIIMI